MKKAFLVGINKYPDSPLNGCVNDCLLMYKVLSEKFGFENNNIDIVTDQQCTRNNIVNGLKKLTSNLSPNDIIFFHYSGHGSQVVVNDWTQTPEADGRDEIICPVDMDWNNPLRDQDLKDIFIKIPKGVKSTIILDSCHSGTGLRNGTSTIVKNRFLPPPINNILSNPKITLDDDLNCIFPEENKKDIQTIKNKFLISTTEQGDSVLISGCKDNQTSADAYFGNTKRYHGALTYTLVDVLKQKNFKITYQELITKLNETLKKTGFNQEPQLECRKELFTNQFAN